MPAIEFDDGRGSGVANELLALADWRRRVAEVYGEVRRSADPVRGHALWRERRDELFRSHPQSPLDPRDPMRAAGVPYWPYDPQLRFRVRLKPVSAAKAYEIPTGEHELTRIVQVGWADLPDPVAGRLAVWRLEQYGGGIFVPFRDGTAGHTSYGAGRYLLDTAKGADLGADGDRLVLDFNFAYHPSCRYDSRWQCPLAPPENHLDGGIEAGEKMSH